MFSGPHNRSSPTVAASNAFCSHGIPVICSESSFGSQGMPSSRPETSVTSGFVMTRSSEKVNNRPDLNEPLAGEEEETSRAVVAVRRQWNERPVLAVRILRVSPLRVVRVQDVVGDVVTNEWIASVCDTFRAKITEEMRLVWVERQEVGVIERFDELANGPLLVDSSSYSN